MKKMLVILFVVSTLFACSSQEPSTPFVGIEFTYPEKMAVDKKKTLANGDVLIGEAVSGDGFGVQCRKSKDRYHVVYEGYFNGGKYNGIGQQVTAELTPSTGARYYGEFRNGKKNGTGILRSISLGALQVTYYGSFKDGMKEGKGFQAKYFGGYDFFNGTFKEDKESEGEKTSDIMKFENPSLYNKMISIAEPMMDWIEAHNTEHFDSVCKQLKS